MIPKKSLDSVLDKSIILTITAPNDNAKSISVQCAPALRLRQAWMSLYKQMNFRVMDTDLIKGMDGSNSVKTNIYYLNFITCDRFQEQCSKPFQFMDNQLNV